MWVNNIPLYQLFHWVNSGYQGFNEYPRKVRRYAYSYHKFIGLGLVAAEQPAKFLKPPGVAELDDIAMNISMHRLH